MNHARSICARRGPIAPAVALTAFTAFALAATLASPAGAGSKTAAPAASTSARRGGPPAHVAGIPEFPDSRRTEGDPDGDGAQAVLRLSVITLEMQALRFDTGASQSQVLDFYRERLAPLGKLSESNHGPDTDFDDFHWEEAPGQHTIAVEGDDRVYMVVTKPHGKGCQFALLGLRFNER